MHEANARPAGQVSAGHSRCDGTAGRQRPGTRHAPGRRTGSRLPGTRVLLATQAENRFEFVDVASPPVPSLLRDFSAPVKLSGLSPDRLRFLAAHDTDPFVRWESGQQFAATVLLDMVAAIQAGGEPAVDPALIEAAASTPGPGTGFRRGGVGASRRGDVG